LGRELEEIEPDGSSTYRYVLNAADLPVLSLDPMWRPTLDSYNASGDLLQETAADGS
jgi:YD repeat-containing protein